MLATRSWYVKKYHIFIHHNDYQAFKLLLLQGVEPMTFCSVDVTLSRLVGVLWSNECAFENAANLNRVVRAVTAGVIRFRLRISVYDVPCIASRR